MYSPQIDVCERPNEIVILVEMPGVDRRDVQISWKENILTISGNKRRHPDTGVAKYMCVERNYGPFRREILIGIAIDHKHARAELREGLMKIHLPKISEDKEHNTIPIE
jgi:HSP20 family protein